MVDRNRQDKMCNLSKTVKVKNKAKPFECKNHLEGDKKNEYYYHKKIK